MKKQRQSNQKLNQSSQMKRRNVPLIKDRFFNKLSSFLSELLAGSVWTKKNPRDGQS